MYPILQGKGKSSSLTVTGLRKGYYRSLSRIPLIFKVKFFVFMESWPFNPFSTAGIHMKT